MGTYKLNHGYEAYRDGTRFGPWAKGDLVNLDAADAEWVERDSAGALSKVDDKATTGPAAPVVAAGARPRVGGNPDQADAAAVAQERVHAEARERQAAPPDSEETDEDEAPERQQRTGRDRQHRGGRNRSG